MPLPNTPYFCYSTILYNSLMIELNIPGRGTLELEHLVCDVNGTLALDGHLLDGVARALNSLRDRLTIHLLTADSHGRQAIIDKQLGLKAVIIPPGEEQNQKAAYIHQLGANYVVAVGQGANDSSMLKEAALGICVLSTEGTALATLLAADILVTNIFEAFELLENPLRIVTTLRQ